MGQPLQVLGNSSVNAVRYNWDLMKHGVGYKRSEGVDCGVLSADVALQGLAWFCACKFETGSLPVAGVLR